MKAVIKIAFNNIMKKKLQSLLILLIIFIAAALFTASLNFMLSVDKPFQETHEKLSGFDNLIYVNPSKQDVDKLVSLFRNNKEVKEVDVRDCYVTNQYAEVNGKQIKEAYRIEEKKNKNTGIDKLITLEGDDGASPKKGEVWISKDVADSKGIKLNDKVEFTIDGQIITKKVGALVVDPGLGNQTIGVCRFWIGKGELEGCTSKDKIYKSISVIFKNCGDGDDVNLNVESSLGKPIGGSGFKYSSIKYANTVVFKITGEVLLVIAAFILLFAFVIIIITITNAIFNDFKDIGIESSIGFTKFQIMMNYVVHFFVLSLLGSLTGITAGTEFSNTYLQKFYNSLGFAKVTIPVFKTSLITIITVTAFVIISSLLSSGSVFKVSPVEAIREGNAPVKEKEKSSISLMLMKKFSLSFSMAIKSILNNKRQNLLIFILIGAAVYIMAFCINTRAALNNIDKNSTYWGLEKSDISLIVKSNKAHDEIMKDMEEIKNDSRVGALSNLYLYGNISMEKTNKVPSQSLVTMVYDTDFNSIELQNIDGQNPKGDDEISISDKLSKKYDKKTGDYFNIYINGKKKNLIITGVYQSVFHMGESIRLNSELLDETDANYKNQIPIQSSIVVKNEKDISKMKNDLQKKYGNDYEISEGHQYLSNITKTDFKPINIVMIIIIVSFAIVAVICIFNLNLINIYGYKKDLGIYKAIGFTNLGIVKIYIYKILMLILISILLAIPLDSMTQNLIMSTILSSMGIVNLPMPMCLGEISVSLCTFTILITMAVMISCRVIAGINGRELISE